MAEEKKENVVTTQAEETTKISESKPVLNTPLIKKVSLTATTKISAPIAQETTQKKELVEAPPTHKDQPIDLELLKTYWQEFAEKRKNEGKSSEYQLLNQEISFNEGYIIHIELTNAIQQNFLESIRTDLLTFLRQKLKNYKLTIKAKLLESEQKEMIYTATEKFNHLAKDYPNLSLMKDELGLDTDF